MAERKRYIEVKIPLLSSEMRVLGTHEDLNNKTIKLDLTRKLRGKGLTITFRILKNEKTLIGLPNRFELSKAYIRRMMRKRVDYVEDSFSAKCSDIEVKVKPLLITRKRVSRAVRKNLRNTSRKIITSKLKDRTFNDHCAELLDGTFQKELLIKLKKIYPLSFCDIRVFETKELGKIDISKIISKDSSRVKDIQEINEEDFSDSEEVETESVKEERDGEKND